MSTESTPVPVVILVNGPSSSGKSTLCRALQDRLTDLADGDLTATFASVAFDDKFRLISDKLYSIDFVTCSGGDLNRLASREPNDGRAAWEYIDDGKAEGKHGGSPRIRLVLHPHTRRLLTGIHRGWGEHLKLGTNLIIDHFLQEREWCEELFGVLKDSGARIFLVGIYCSLQELERRETSRADGRLEGRPLVRLLQFFRPKNWPREKGEPPAQWLGLHIHPHAQRGSPWIFYLDSSGSCKDWGP